MPILALLRHGQSQWNLENRFTGWVDVDLSEAGVAEAARGGVLLAQSGLQLDFGFTSVLTRAIRTADVALHHAGQLWIPLVKDWRLNERHYGALTGLDKAETAKLHGEAQVKIWRRSYDVPPPAIGAESSYDLGADRRYRGVEVPSTESLKTTLERVSPYWNAEIVPRLGAGQAILVAAHGNSLRAIVKHLFAVPQDEITELEIPTGNPLIIDLDEAMRPRSARYLDASRATALPPNR